MEMTNGMAIIERDDTQTKAFFIDHEVLEFARMNAQTKKRASAAEAKKKEAAHNRRKAEKAKARWRAYTLKTFSSVLTHFGIIGAVAWAGMAGLIHPVTSIPVILFCVATACLRLGVWFGKVVR